MVKRPITWIVMALVAGLLVFWSFSRDQDEERIRKTMNQLCALAELEKKESPLVAAATSKGIGAYFTPDVYFEPGSIPYPSALRSRREFEAIVFQGRTMFDSIAISLRDTRIEIIEKGKTALMNVSLHVRLADYNQSGQDWRALTMQWTQQDGDWLISNVKVVETIRQPH